MLSRVCPAFTAPAALRPLRPNRSAFARPCPARRPRRVAAAAAAPRRARQPCCVSGPPDDDDGDDDQAVWAEALEGLLVEALRAYYQGTPAFSDAEFNTLRDEVEHLGLSSIRLHDMEKLFVQASSSRDFDRRVCKEFGLSEDDLDSIKTRLLVSGKLRIPDRRPTPASASKSAPPAKQPPHAPGLPPTKRAFVSDAQNISADERVDERLKWLLFSDATEDRLKILLLYLPAVLMSFVTASVFTILFALLDGEMQISVTAAGRVRLGILSYVVVVLTMWFSNQVTPVMLDYLDLGQPRLMRGACPVCGAAVSCLFTGAARHRDERSCRVCGAVVGFNRRWNKLYLVSPPKSTATQQPD